MEANSDFQLLTTRMPKISKHRRDSDSEIEVSSHVIAAIEDLLTEILIRLPVKSLLRFKSVSKEWLSLISSPQFRDLKSKRLSKDISGILLKRDYSPVSSNPEYEFIPVGENYKQDVTQSESRRSSPMRSLNFVCAEKKIEAVQYCNGLLLCKDSKTAQYYDSLLLCKDSNPVENVVCKYYVFNPSTKDYTTLSLDRVLDSGEIDPVEAANLAFDPRKSPHYKLICIYRSEVPANSPGEYEYDDRMELGIYSSETGVVRQIDVHFRSDPDYAHGLYWNGAVNWIDYKEDGLFFNVEEERLGSLPMLPRVDYTVDDDYDYLSWEGRWIRYFGVSNDHMHLIDMDIPSEQFDVYAMDKGYAGWFVRFHVDLQPILSSFAVSSSEEELWDNIDFIEEPMWDRDYFEFGVLAVVEKDDDSDEESFLVLSIPGRAVRLNLKDKSFTSLCDLDEEYGCKGSIQFIESLSRVQF